jgi:hypothetical protein
MLVLVSWTLLFLISATLVGLALEVAESAWAGGRLGSTRARLVGAVVAAAVLLLVAVLYQSHAVAVPDGHLIDRIAASPGSPLAQVMTYVTLLGDSVSSLVIASALALITYRQGRHTYACAILPVLVLAELYIQLGMWKVFDDATIGTLHPLVPIGGPGQIPSGSVARLLSVFLVASLLWSAYDVRGARRVATLGGVLTLIQCASRLVLGRHLYADLVAGMALGLMLTLLATAVIGLSRPHGAAQTGDAPPAGSG